MKVTQKSGLRHAAEVAAQQLQILDAALGNPERLQVYRSVPPLAVADLKAAVGFLADLLEAVEGNLDAFEHATIHMRPQYTPDKE